MTDEENLRYDQMTFPMPEWQKQLLSEVWLPVLLAPESLEARDE